MSPLAVIAIQSTLSIVIFLLITQHYIAPVLRRLPKEDAFVPLLFLNAFRYLPFILFAPGQISPQVSENTKSIIAYGDFISAILALLSVLFLIYRIRGAIALVWIFFIVGVADSLIGTYTALTAQLQLFPLGFGWVIVAFFVPMIFVSEAMIGFLLFTKGK